MISSAEDLVAPGLGAAVAPLDRLHLTYYVFCEGCARRRKEMKMAAELERFDARLK